MSKKQKFIKELSIIVFNNDKSNSFSGMKDVMNEMQKGEESKCDKDDDESCYYNMLLDDICSPMFVGNDDIAAMFDTQA